MKLVWVPVFVWVPVGLVTLTTSKIEVWGHSEQKFNLQRDKSITPNYSTWALINIEFVYTLVQNYEHGNSEWAPNSFSEIHPNPP